MKHLKQMFSALLATFFVVSSSIAFAGNDDVNWDEGKIVATGMGIAPPNAVNIAQAKILARRAAVVDAYRQMAETIKGVQVTSESTVENAMVLSDKTRTKVEAMIKGARVIKEGMTPDGAYEVTMVVPMFGVTGSLASAVLEQPKEKEAFPEPVASVQPTTPASVSTTVTVNVPTVTTTPSAPAPTTPTLSIPSVPSIPSTPGGSSAAPAPAGRAIGVYTGLVVDCRGLGLNPVMSPVIKNESGSPIYGYKNLDPDKIIANGMASYSKDINSYKRAGTNPLVVKAIRLDGHNANPVLSIADANRVLIENGATKFLDNTNVVFVR